MFWHHVDVLSYWQQHLNCKLTAITDKLPSNVWTQIGLEGIEVCSLAVQMVQAFHIRECVYSTIPFNGVVVVGWSQQLKARLDPYKCKHLSTLPRRCWDVATRDYSLCMLKHTESIAITDLTYAALPLWPVKVQTSWNICVSNQGTIQSVLGVVPGH